jgi:hypothetical protein
MRESGTSIDAILNLTRRAKVIDSRDKVYGMLGLLPFVVTDQIKPDYYKTRDSVFIEPATSILN